MPWLRRYAPILILLLAAFLRFYHFTSTPPALWRDEAMNGDNCLQNIESRSLSVFYPENSGREGLYINLATFSVFAFGNTPWALRLPAAIFGVLTVWAVFLLAGELFSRRVALLAAFFIATSFWHLIFSRLGLRAIAAPFFLTMALYLLLVGLRQARTGVLLAAGVIYGLGVYTYIAYRATPLLVALVLVYGCRKSPGRQFWKCAAAFCGAAILTAAPLAIYFWTHPGSFSGRTSQISVMQDADPALEVIRNVWRTGRMFFTHGDRNWRHNIPYRAELFWPVALFFAAGVLAAIARLRRFGNGLLLAWLVVAAAPAVLSDESVPHALRSILLVPAVFMLAALGAEWLYVRTPRIFAIPLAMAVALVLAYEPYHAYFQVWAQTPEATMAMDGTAVEVAHSVNAMPRDLAKYVVADESAAWVVQYLTRSYTPRQRADSNINYVLKDFQTCQAAAAAVPHGDTVFCVE